MEEIAPIDVIEVDVHMILGDFMKTVQLCNDPSLKFQLTGPGTMKILEGTDEGRRKLVELLNKRFEEPTEIL